MKAVKLLQNKVGTDLKREFRTEPKGVIGRFIVMGGLIFMTYSIVMFNGDFSMAFNHITEVIKSVKG